MDKNDPRYQNLVRASQMTRVQKEIIDKKIDNMSEDELLALQSQQYELENESGFTCIGADNNSGGGVFVNYRNMPNKKREPWEGALATGAPAYYDMPMSNNGQQPRGAIDSPTVLPNFETGGVQIFGMPQQQQFGGMMMQQYMDKRVVTYNSNPGMRYYNLNPYNFMDEKDLMNYFEYLEEQRKNQCSAQWCWYTLGIRGGTMEGDLEDYDYLKFKSANDIVREAMEEQQREQRERLEEIYGTPDNPKTVYDQYDKNGYRFKRVRPFKLINVKTGEITAEFHQDARKDENGLHYEIRHITEDRKEEMELKKKDLEVYNAIVWTQTFWRVLGEHHAYNDERWARWRAQGLEGGALISAWLDDEIDWKKHEGCLVRALRMQSYSKEDFHEILSKCCHTDLIYSNKGDFYGIGYDYERDLHYKSLISTVEEMDNDPAVHQRLQMEYDKRREMFMKKVDSGDFRCVMATDFGFNPNVLPKPNIDKLTLEDYDKPENQIMYDEFECPERSFQNAFIPKDKTMTQDKVNDYVKQNQAPDLDRPDEELTQEEYYLKYYGG